MSVFDNYSDSSNRHNIKDSDLQGELRVVERWKYRSR